MTNISEMTMKPVIVPPSVPLSVFGTEIRVLLNAEQTGNQYTAYRCDVPPNVGPPPHRHEAFDEAFVVLEGAFEVVCGEDIHTVGPGTTVFVPRGLVHTFRNVGQETATFLGTATPAGHEAFFEDADSLTGPLTLEAAVALCERHGIEIVVA